MAAGVPGRVVVDLKRGTAEGDVSGVVDVVGPVEEMKMSARSVLWKIGRSERDSRRRKKNALEVARGPAGRSGSPSGGDGGGVDSRESEDSEGGEGKHS